MSLLEGISGRLSAVEHKLQCLDKMDHRMAVLEKDMKTLWLALDDKVTTVEERVSKLELISDGADIAAAQVSSRLDERKSLRDDLTYMKANLVFTGVPETENESPETTEKIPRKHLSDAVKIAHETADTIRFERVHRSLAEHSCG
ncbi:hypothetical protein DPMN_065957 [Dreissena polymorpha]|uniref:Uncharacterized protein n=1 Tax=Dreissena polymorpha TaxID=45954 RepID=A0A9D3YWW9_DREPO|nr:hypothetical protein DPMN_065957 [Dreissena polymorpha]